MFHGIPSFYDIRKNGLISALRDGVYFRSKLASEINIEKSDVLIFEKRDFRNKLIAYNKARIHEPIKRSGIYLDRKEVIESVLRESIGLRECVRLGVNPQTVLINPSSRRKEKAIAPLVLHTMIDYLNQKNMKITLVDPDGGYGHCRPSVCSYRGQLTMDEAADLLRQSDLYIGADSFFLHFAYYLRVPCLVIYNGKENLYFAPPGIEINRNYIVVERQQLDHRLTSDLDSFFSQKLNRMAAEGGREVSGLDDAVLVMPPKKAHERTK